MNILTIFKNLKNKKILLSKSLGKYNKVLNNYYLKKTLYSSKLINKKKTFFKFKKKDKILKYYYITQYLKLKINIST